MTKNYIGFGERGEREESGMNSNQGSYSEAHARIEDADNTQRYIGFQRAPCNHKPSVLRSTIGYVGGTKAPEAGTNYSLFD